MKVVILADGSGLSPRVIIAATGFSMDLNGLVGHLGVLDARGKLPGGFASDVGDGMFAIGYGIPPNGPLRAIRRAASPLAREIAAYLATTSSTTAGHAGRKKRAAVASRSVTSTTPGEQTPLGGRLNG